MNRSIFIFEDNINMASSQLLKSNKFFGQDKYAPPNLEGRSTVI